MGWGSLGSSTQIAVRLMLLGGPQYSAQLKTAAAQTMALGRATLTTGRAMHTASKNTWIQNQALYTFRRYAFFGTLAITALAVGVAKLGYSYLATRDSARAALSPIIHGTVALNKELDSLFKLSKYSPFILKDMTDALRVMYPSLHGAGLGISEMNSLLLSMTNILSQSGRTTPKALSQISYAIQHMLYQGRLTGRLTQSLAAAGVPVPELLARLGYAHANLSSIARLNIAPQNVIRALTEMGQAGIFKDAARRQALRSLPGMFQVLKDSLSQLIGTASEGTYNRFKANMKELVGPGGFLDRLGSAKNGSQAIMMLSNSLTGSGLAGTALLMLADTLRQIVRVFVNGVIPAFRLGLVALLPFIPILFVVNRGLEFLADHAWIVKYALAPLAAAFIYTHTAMLAFWVTSKLITIATFGNAMAFKKVLVWLVAYALGTNTATVANAGLISSLAALRFVALSTWISMLGPLALVAAALYLIIRYHERIAELTLSIGGSRKPTAQEVSDKPHHSALHNFWRSLIDVGHSRTPGLAAGGTILRSGTTMVGEHGPEILNLPRGSSVIPLSKSAVQPIDFSSVGSGDGSPKIFQLVVDRKVLAQAVAREGEDRKALR